MMTLRNELSTLYRTQAASQNKQLQMADALRDRDEEVRGMREEVRLLREAKEASAKKEREWEERWRYRTKDMEVGLHAVSVLMTRR
jgi:indole-3-glycerol phosphate synthase